MRILVVGTGGVGAAVAAVAQRRDFFERITLADVDPTRPQAVVDRLGEQDRFAATRVDASSSESVIGAISATAADAVLNACDPRFNAAILAACLETHTTYLDMALTLGRNGTILGEEQFAQHEAWRRAGTLCLAGIGADPGLADVFARYAADHLFAEIDEIGVRDGGNLVVDGKESVRSSA